MVAAAQVAAVVAVTVAVVTTTALSAAAVAAVHLALVLAVAVAVALGVVQASVMARAECRLVQTRQAVGRHSVARLVAVLPVTATATMMVYSTGRAESSRLGR